MRVSMVLWMLVLSAAMCACNPADDTGQPAGKQPVAAATDTGAATSPADAGTEEPVLEVPPSSWPGWFPPYPNSVLKSTQLIENGNGSGLQAELATGDPKEDVVDFYHTRIMETGAYLRQIEKSPESIAKAYIGQDHDISVWAFVENDVTVVRLLLLPIEPFEGEYPPLQIQWAGVQELPPGFPADILPLYTGAELQSSTVAGELYAVIDSTIPASLDEVIDFYREYYQQRQWRVEYLSSSETAYNVMFFKDGQQITAGIGMYADGTVFASLVYEPVPGDNV